MADINLLPQEQQSQEKFVTLQKKLSIASIAMLSVTGLITLLTLIFFASVASRKNQLYAAVSDVSGKIESHKKTEELAVVVKSKATVADEILKSRDDHGKMLSSLADLIPQNVYFTDIKFTDKKISLSGKAKTSADVAGLVASLLSSRGSSIVNNVSVDSLNSDESGVYQMSLSMSLTK